MITTSTNIERGNDEMAYFLRDGNQDSWQNYILKKLEYIECPKHSCYFHISKALRYTKTPIFGLLFQHFRDKHYHLENHTKFENFSYQIIQELACFEAARYRKTAKALEKREIVTHNLIKHLGIPLIDVALLLEIGTARAGELSYQGKIICQHCDNPTENIDPLYMLEDIEIERVEK